MEQQLFRDDFISKLDENFTEVNYYFDYRYKVFFAFSPIVFQAAKCIILELHFATITLTNHILERLLKLALITKAVGIKGIPTEKWNSVFLEPHQKYSSINLGNSIELCRKENLITESEKDTLFTTVRELMRNGFSHADATKILANLPDKVQMFQGTLNEPTKLEEISMNPKVIPPLQALHMENFAKLNATNYFKYVFKLLEDIENRIVQMDSN
ncbi:hypothetical protein [Parafilimonas sp.]|uniref:hypothetical protein n=1 Tax=Parafilimonas sp. TaxID=1969739 RepID=UPI003F7E023E